MNAPAQTTQLTAVADPARLHAEVEIEVPFFDVDAMEIVWHGHYVKYFEIARCALLDQIQYNYREMKSSGYAWPIVDLHLRYVRPAEFSQRIRVYARIVEWEHRLRILYRITDAASGRKLTSGHSVQVAVEMANRQLCFQTPPVLWEKLGVRL